MNDYGTYGADNIGEVAYIGLILVLLAAAVLAFSERLEWE